MTTDVMARGYSEIVVPAIDAATMFSTCGRSEDTRRGEVAHRLHHLTGPESRCPCAEGSSTLLAHTSPASLLSSRMTRVPR